MADKKKRRGRGEGSVEQLPDGRWRAVLSLGIDPTTGKRRRLKLYGQAKAEALARLRATQAQHQSGELAGNRTTFGAWSDRYLEVRKHATEPNTHARHEWTVRKHLKPHLATLELGKITAMHVEGLYAALQREGVSQNERRRAGGCLSMILAYAVKRRRIGRNPATEVPKPKRIRTEFTAWTTEQAAACFGRLFGNVNGPQQSPSNNGSEKGCKQK
jgi:integrase